MKKLKIKQGVFAVLLAFLCANSFAQKVIERPDHGFSTFDSTIEKIELLDTTTVIHFHYRNPPGSKYSIPKKTFIQDAAGGEKLYITKGGEGIKLNKWQKMPESGEIFYKLYFPKLDKNVKAIDFGEDISKASWAIYDIVLIEDKGSKLIPKVLKGNWLLADGSNKWEYSFNPKNAILDRTIWNYKSVDVKGKKYTITLVNNGVTKTIYAKLNKNGKVSFGKSPKALKTYSLKPIDVANYKIPNNEVFKDDFFRVDSTTYSGFIKGFSSKVGQKTGTAYINNTFTGNQERYLIRINDNGSFSVKVPISYPQSLLVKLPGYYGSVFVEQGKETFHLINNDKKSLFMGDCAQINTDLQKTKFIQFFNYRKIMNKIGETAPEDFKKICFNVRDKELKALDSINRTQVISAKAYQIKKLDIEYSTYQNILGYGMHRRGLEQQNKAAKTEKDKKPFKPFTVENSFYDFITKEDLNNKLAILNSSYKYFINRLMFADVFKIKQPGRVSTADVAAALQKENVELTEDELAMAEMSKTIQTPEAFAKESEFGKAHGAVEQGFYKKYAQDFSKFSKYNKEKPKHHDFRLNLADYVIEKGDTLTPDEVKMIEAVKVLNTPQEIAKQKEFNKAYGAVMQAFYNKYGDRISDISSKNYYSKIDNNMYEYFNDSKSFTFDVIRFQRANKRLEDYAVYRDVELKSIQKNIEDAFVSSYLAIENERTKTQIELNKAKGGYNVNTVENTEGDELFNSIIKKYKGKVVYVDFWATWCGPCKSGIKKIRPLKEEMKNEDVVFLYITNQTSPEGSWKNSIPNIKGEHYRVTSDEWNYLSDKFKITGIPHYTLVNKKGEIVEPKMGYNSNAKLKSILSKEIKKEI